MTCSVTSPTGILDRALRNANVVASSSGESSFSSLLVPDLLMSIAGNILFSEAGYSNHRGWMEK